jgi:hypothetical protein
MALVSPGLSITVTDESQYISNAVGTVPLVIMATAENKTLNGALCTGTTKANAGQLQVFTSQRDLSTAMGYPVFQQSSAGTPLNGNELNEYGLMAAYSALGLGNQLYAIRADIDLNELQGTSVRPTSPVASGTQWFDVADTTWGINEWSASSQSFTTKSPLVITTNSQITTSTQANLSNVPTPLQTLGSIGSYAVVNTINATTNYSRIFYKAGTDSGDGNINLPVSGSSFSTLNNNWVMVGTPNWHKSHPTVVGTLTSPTLTNGGNLQINGGNVTLSGSNVFALATSINSALIPGISADTVSGKIAIYSTGNIVTISTTYNGVGNTTLISAAGLSTGTFNPTTFTYGSFAQVPYWTSADATNAPNGSVWFEVGATGGGANFVVNEYNSTTGLWNTEATSIYPTEFAALYGLDPLGGGANIPVGTLYVIENPNQISYAGFSIFERTTAGAVTAIGSTTPSSTAFTSGSTFILAPSQPGSSTATYYTITLPSTGSSGPNDFVNAILKANIPNVTASIVNGSIAITHLTGGSIVLTPGAGFPTVLAIAGFGSNGTNILVNSFTGWTVITGFSPLTSSTLVASTTQPVADPADGTLWYFSDPTQVDIMVNMGSYWAGYQNVTSDVRGYNLSLTDATGVIVSASTPTTQVNGNALANGDLWLNTSDLEKWPALSRYNGRTWVAIDNTDHVSQNGIIFADARWDNSGTNDPASGTQITTEQLLTSNYLDLDAPNAALYPRGMLLFNTRRSGYNVKKYVADYFTPTAFSVPTWSSSTTYTFDSSTASNPIVYYGSTLYVLIATQSPTATPPSSNPNYWSPLITGSWVTASGLNPTNDVPYSGHYAQRQMVVAAMNAAVEANTEIREEQFSFQLICAPGYPELITNMVALNNDRANTAFVIGDTPLGLDTSVVDLTNWSNDTNGTGLATNDPYCAVYYPSGLSTDLGGNTIVVPPSHMALRTYLYNDNVAYPWFAPAGTRRGLVNNATDLGYVDYTTGEFVRTGVAQGLRDALYQLNINPITILPGIGIVIWGQKTRDPNTESMDRVNVSRLVNYIRTIFANAGNAFLFEPNDKITRDQFAAQLNSALNDLVAKRGLYDYLVVCDTTNNTPDIIANNELYADVAIEPEKAVEFIYIPIRLYNPGTVATLGSA